MAIVDRTSLILQLVDSIVQGLTPEKVILFGSQAKGQVDEDSDIDLLIVADSKQDRLERTWRVYRLLKGKRNSPLDVIVLTPREYEEMKNRGYPFIREIEEEGTVLYERSR